MRFALCGEQSLRTCLFRLVTRAKKELRRAEILADFEGAQSDDTTGDARIFRGAVKRVARPSATE
jgi:hypothetical protein